MKHKQLFLICFSLIVLFSLMNMVESKTFFFNANNTLLSIDECEGPIKVRVGSYIRLRDDELNFFDCEKQSNYVWTCDCKGSRDIVFNVSSQYANAYSFEVLYYLDYFKTDPPKINPDGSSVPSDSQIRLDSFSRKYYVKDVVIRKPITIFDIQLNTTFGSIFMACLIIVVAISMFAFNKFKNHLRNSTDIDVGDGLFKPIVSNKDEDFDKLISKLDQEFKEDAKDDEPLIPFSK